MFVKNRYGRSHTRVWFLQTSQNGQYRLAAGYLCAVFLQKNGSVDEYKDQIIEVHDCHTTPMVLVLAVRHLCDGFLCKRNNRLGKGKAGG